MRVLLKLKIVRFVLVGVFAWTISGLAYAENLRGASMGRFNLTDLNGYNGFIARGEPGERIGLSVRGAGDVNGDKKADFVVGSAQSKAYVVFGHERPWPAKFNLTKAASFTIFDGGREFDYLDILASGAGDMNEDGFGDIVLSAFSYSKNVSRAHLVFGGHQTPQELYLTDLDGNNGVSIVGFSSCSNNFLTMPVSEAGDVNGDGISDIIIGAPWMDEGRGVVFVLFGRQEPWPPVFNVADLDGSNGFVIKGINPGDYSGCSISGGVDVNDDGLSDIIIGAAWANERRGRCCVVFGRKEWPAVVILSELNGYDGIVINGINTNDYCGYSVSGTKDTNGDGIDDFLISAIGAGDFRGQVYLIFGRKSAWPPLFDLLTLDGSNGSVINGINLDDMIGFSVSGAGDFDGDGLGEILIGAPEADGKRGQTYLIYGRKKWPAIFNLSGVTSWKDGIILSGGLPGFIGDCVSAAGDLDGDNLDDFLIGASSGSYGIFGSNSTLGGL